MEDQNAQPICLFANYDIELANIRDSHDIGSQYQVGDEYVFVGRKGNSYLLFVTDLKSFNLT